MASDDVSTTIAAVTKRPISRKHRILSHSQSTGQNLADNFRQNRTLTATQRPSSKLPNLLAKANIYPSTPPGKLVFKVFLFFNFLFAVDSVQLRRHHSQQGDKLERQSTNINSLTRLPTLYSLRSDYDRKLAIEYQRRQVGF
jgi:hypothetical protein